MKDILKRALPHVLCVFVFTVVLFIYYSPILSGKKLVQNDFVQAVGSLKEATDYSKSSSEEILWSNSMFSGMPVWRGYSSNFIKQFHIAISNTIPSPILLGMMGFIGFYILMLSIGCNFWIAFLASSAFVFSSFNIISIEAGHINKVYDMALMAPVIGGIIFTYKKRYWLGAAITALFLSLHIFYGHYQITYYLIICILFVVLYFLHQSILFKQINLFIKSSLILILSAAIAVGPNISQIWTTKVYSKSTQREGSELASKIENSKKGLDKDYTFAWSNGITEVLSIYIPYIHGGSSNEELGQNSDSYKALTSNGVPKSEAKSFIKNIPLYWGNQPFTSGPIYFGATVFFLFILSLFLVKDNIRWWMLALSVLAIALSWGKNFEVLSNIFYDYVPLYNKFRSVTMIMSIAQITFPLMAGYALLQISKSTLTEKQFIHGLKWSVIICVGISLFFALFGGVIFDFSSDNDAQLKQQFPDWLLQAILQDRENKLQSDALRSLIIVVISGGVLWAFLKSKITSTMMYVGLSVLVLLDLTLVDKRYLNNSSFKPASFMDSQALGLTEIDAAILKDTSYHRVLNFSKSPFNDATTSFYHKSAGGYSAIKLGRYQDLIERQLSKNNINAYNMLNIKYFIVPDQKTQQPMLQQNPDALGNAWFVNKYEVAANADAEMNCLDTLNTRLSACISKDFAKDVQGVATGSDSLSQIKLVAYHPNRLAYNSTTTSDRLAIFSEIYYQPGWNAYIDGKLTPHVRANYVLRGLKVPAGNHKIEFKFEPEHYFLTEKISLYGSILLILFIVGILVKEIVSLNRHKPIAA